MANRKSCRPCSKSVGTVSEWSLGRDERAASVLLTTVVTAPSSRSSRACASVGSHVEGTDCASRRTRPSFGTPFGLRAVPRSVQATAGTIALNATPATAAFQTSPPPSERPSAPIWVFETSLRPANQLKRSCASCTSMGPARPNLPPEPPVPRASQASAAKLNRASTDPIGSRSARDCPSPWKRMTPGQPPAGAVPAGMTYAHASGVASEVLIVTSVHPDAAEAPPAHTSAAARMATATRTRPTSRTLARIYDGRHGLAARRRVRLRRRRVDGPPRVPRDDAERGLRLSRRPCAPAVRAASAGRDSPLLTRDRRLSLPSGREAHPRRVQRCDLGRATAAAGGADGAGRRRDHARGARGRAGDAQPAGRAPPPPGAPGGA